MQYSHHVIRNVGKNPTILKRLRANILFNIGTTRYWWRNHFLTKKDFNDSASLIQTGDIILVGNHRTLLALFLRSIVTHSLVYIGNGDCIHANGDGVERISYRDLFDIYDTLIVIRVNAHDEQKDRAVVWMRNKLGLPYDYTFDTRDTEEWYCTKLVCAAYEHADASLPPCRSGHMVLARDFVSGIGTHIFHSESLCEHKGKLVLNPAFYRDGLLRTVFANT